MAPKFKLVILGDGGVGKSTFVRRPVMGIFETGYYPNTSLALVPVTFHTNPGPVEFVMWDTVGQEKTGDLKQLYYIDSDCAIIMFDLTGRETLKSVQKWERDLRRVCPDIPIVLVGNKCD